MKHQIISLVAILAVLAWQICPQNTPEPPATLPSQLNGIDIQINKIRSQNGLKPLKLSNELNKSAQYKADDMESRDYFDHIPPTGESIRTQFIWQVDYEHFGENLAKCYPTTQEAVNAWVESSTHYKNIVGDYEYFGFGTYTKDGCTVIVNHFKR